MDFIEYQKKYFKTNPNYLAVYIVNNLNFETVIDLGCGSGNETVYMLKKGKKVIAVDKNLNEDYIISRIKSRDNLTVVCASFEEYKFPKVDAILSTFSLSFCDEENFSVLWNKIYNALPVGGVFAGNLFGKRDSFDGEDGVSTFSKEEIDILFKNFEIVKFKEQEYDQEVSGKHRHYYDFVAIRR